MSIKTRVITIRMSVVEYENLSAATKSKGYRNVSECARAAIDSLVREQLAPHQMLALRVDELANRFGPLALAVGRLLGEPAEMQNRLSTKSATL